MLIKRVKAIKKIGGFYNFANGGAVPFVDDHHLTVVFGRNTHGKSTLAEIFSSLGEDDPSILESRESIPPDPSVSRLVDISYIGADGGEKSVELKADWSANELTGNIDVFDEEFTHRNLIAGSELTRDNHEYLTSFILGREGVLLSEEIGKRKKDIRDRKGLLKKLRPPFVLAASSDQVVEKFVKLSVSESEADLLKDKGIHEKTIHRVREADSFLRLPDIPTNPADESAALLKLIKDTSDTLLSGYRDVTDEVQASLQRHIDQHCGADPGAMSWLKTGQKYCGDGVCPFCGGDMEAGNRDLVEAFGQLFNAAFEEHNERIQSEIAGEKAEVARLTGTNLPNAIQRVIEAASKFEPFVGGLDDLIAELNDQMTPLLDAQDPLCQPEVRHLLAPNHPTGARQEDLKNDDDPCTTGRTR